jgi:hypothetical protein
MSRVRALLTIFESSQRGMRLSGARVGLFQQVRGDAGDRHRSLPPRTGQMSPSKWPEVRNMCVSRLDSLDRPEVLNPLHTFSFCTIVGSFR